MRGDRVAAVVAFYADNPNAHIWPRQPEQLAQLAKDMCLFEAVDDDGRVVGVAYVVDDPHENRWELGGVYMLPECRGTGVAKTLGRVRLIHLYTQLGLQDEQVISHVHEANQDPRPMLESLGFEMRGQEIVPPEYVPKGMKLNDEGQLVGHLYVFNPVRLAQLADWLEGYGGVSSKGTAVALDVALFTKDRARTVEALRSIATEAQKRAVPSEVPLKS